MSAAGDGRPAAPEGAESVGAAAPGKTPQPAADEALEAVTVGQMRVPRFGAQYLEQARRHLFARHPEYLPFLLRRLDIHPGMTLVDVGCGTGVYTRLMASQLRGEGRVLGIDVHPGMIEQATRNAAQEGWGDLVEFRAGDALELPLPDGCADVAFCNSLLWLLAAPVRALQEMWRILRPGGRALAAEPDGGLVHSYDPARARLSELELRFQECFVKGARALDGHEYEIGRQLPALFLQAGFVRVRAFPRLFVAAGCDLGEDPQRALTERLQEYQLALASLLSQAPEMRAAREKRASRARAGGMTDDELTEHERETIAWLTERVEHPTSILYDGATYLYGGVLCEGLRFDETPATA